MHKSLSLLLSSSLSSYVHLQSVSCPTWDILSGATHSPFRDITGYYIWMKGVTDVNLGWSRQDIIFLNYDTAWGLGYIDYIIQSFSLSRGKLASNCEIQYICIFWLIYPLPFEEYSLTRIHGLYAIEHQPIIHTYARTPTHFFANMHSYTVLCVILCLQQIH